MASELRTQIVSAPVGGYDSEAADMVVPGNKARYLENFLPGRAGKVSLRGPVRRNLDANESAGGTPVTASAFWTFGDALLLGFSSTYRVLNIDTMTYAGASQTFTALGTDRLYPFHVRAADLVYGYTSGASSPDARRNGGTWTSAADARLVSWNGGTSGGSAVKYGATNAPVGGRDIAYHLGRLWVLGGSVPGTSTPVYTSRLYWSMDVTNAALTDAVGSWQSAGVTNQIVLDGSDNDYGVGLALLNGRLVVLRRNSIWMLTGSNPDNFVIRKIANIGCVDQQSILEWDDGIFFLSDTGLVFFDGASTTPVSGPITGELMRASWQGNTTRQVTLARLSSEFFIAAVQYLTGTQRDAWIYHVPTSSWSRFTANGNVFNTAIGTASAPNQVWRTANYPVAWDGVTVHDLSLVANPEAAAYNEVGHDWDNWNLNNKIIPGRIITRNYKLGTPEAKAQLARLLADYRLTGAPGVAAGTLRLNVNVQDERGNAIGLTTLDGDFTSSGTSRIQGLITREVKDLRFEVETVRLDIQMDTASSVAPQVCDVHDLGLEYQVGQHRF